MFAYVVFSASGVNFINGNKTYAAFQQVQTDLVSPLVRLVGASDLGTDLTLSANFSADNFSMTTSTPSTGQPLMAGKHAISVSLNGETFSRMNRVVSISNPFLYG